MTLYEPDEYPRFNTGTVVSHDEFGDYGTNAPIMHGSIVLDTHGDPDTTALSAGDSAATDRRRARQNAADLLIGGIVILGSMSQRANGGPTPSPALPSAPHAPGT